MEEEAPQWLTFPIAAHLRSACAHFEPIVSKLCSANSRKCAAIGGVRHLRRFLFLYTYTSDIQKALLFIESICHIVDCGEYNG